VIVGAHPHLREEDDVVVVVVAGSPKTTPLILVGGKGLPPLDE
jgi:hypothetical protein